jgi:hypothetical protein
MIYPHLVHRDKAALLLVFGVLWAALLGGIGGFACAQSSANSSAHVEITQATDGATCYLIYDSFKGLVGGNCK